jgi:PKHD-type hydroxylase
MQLFNHYWYFTKALSEKFCNRVIELGKKVNKEVAITGHQTLKLQKSKKLSKEELKNLKKIRNSNIAWLSEQWIYDELHPYINEANKNAGWNFQWDWSEACQFTIYKKNQFYDWHADSWEKPYDDPSNLNTNGKIRKLSMTLSLSDENDYEGGDLEFDPRNYHNIKNSKTLICKEVKPKGSLVVFPSFVYHRVTPVTKGTRYSLVMWNLGHPFK